MPDLRRSLPDTLALVRSQYKTSWPNPWWPGATNAQQDCAALVSWALFDLHGNVPYFTVVSGIQNWGKQFGAYHAGSAGIQVGDVIGYDWTGDGGYDHTEICTAVGPHSVVSIGTNSNPGDDVRERTRKRSQILSYIHPPYPGVAAAATKKKRKRKSMPILTQDTTGTYFVVTDLGMYVVPTQLLAECVDRVINYTPTRADLDYYNTLVLGPRYKGVEGGAPAVGTTVIDQAALKAALEAATANAVNQSVDEIQKANEMNPF